MNKINFNNKWSLIVVVSVACSFIFNSVSVGSSSISELEQARQNPQVQKVQTMMKKVGFKNKDQDKSLQLASLIFKEYRLKHIDPKIIVGIIRVESSFNQNAVSKTGDFSIAQINVSTWKVEFERRGRAPLDERRLKTDVRYAISRMTEILEILNEDYSDKKDWFAYYHSKSKDLKLDYYNKVAYHIAKM